MFELNNKNVKKILLIITFALCLAFLLFNFSGAMAFLGIVINIINPLIYGFCIAFLLNIIMKKFDKLFNRANKDNKKGIKKYRKLSIALSVLIVLLIVVITFALVIPQLIDTIQILVKNLPNAAEIVKEWITNIAKDNPEILDAVQNFDPDWEEIIDNVSNTIKDNASGIVGSSVQYIHNVINVVINIVLGFIVAMFMLLKKEHLIEELKKFIKLHSTNEKYNKIIKIGNLSNTKFQKFFIGQFTEAIIVSLITLIAMLIFKMPYALPISVLIGVMSLVPMVGTIIGTLVGAILILAVNPIQALWFIILIFVVQQIEDNLIKPRIVGKNLALPGALTFLAVVIGGSNFGVVGLIVSVPIVSILYELYKEHTKSIEK